MTRTQPTPGRTASPEIVRFPGDPRWESVRRALAADAEGRPAAVAVPQTVSDLAAVVGYARELGLDVVVPGIAPVGGELTGAILVDASLLGTS